MNLEKWSRILNLRLKLSQAIRVNKCILNNNSLWLVLCEAETLDIIEKKIKKHKKLTTMILFLFVTRFEIFEVSDHSKIQFLKINYVFMRSVSHLVYLIANLFELLTSTFRLSLAQIKCYKANFSGSNYWIEFINHPFIILQWFFS